MEADLAFLRDLETIICASSTLMPVLPLLPFSQHWEKGPGDEGFLPGPELATFVLE
jgi:hypothetical protein